MLFKIHYQTAISNWRNQGPAMMCSDKNRDVVSSSYLTHQINYSYIY